MPRPVSTPARVARARRLGSHLRTLREQAGLSRERLARLADVSTETVRKIESGATTSPELFTFVSLMDHLDASIEDVIDEVRDIGGGP
ncbi:helix-turn-helix transcriptional regulator [Nocardioides dilutus]